MGDLGQFVFGEPILDISWLTKEFLKIEKNEIRRS